MLLRDSLKQDSSFYLLELHHNLVEMAHEFLTFVLVFEFVIDQLQLLVKTRVIFWVDLDFVKLILVILAAYV